MSTDGTGDELSQSQRIALRRQRLEKKAALEAGEFINETKLYNYI